MRSRKAAVLPSLLVMKMTLARARWEGGSRKVPRGLQMLVAKGLLAIHQHDVLPPAGQAPILKAVVQQQGVAAKMLNGVAAAFDAVFVHQDDDILEVGGEHVGFVARGVGIQQEGFAVGDHARRGGVLAQEQLVQDHFSQGLGLGTVAAGENGHRAPLPLQFAGEFFHHRGLAGAAKSEVADGDDLDAEGRIADQAGLDAKAVNHERELIDLGEAEQKGAEDAARLPRRCSKMNSRKGVSIASIHARIV